MFTKLFLLILIINTNKTKKEIIEENKKSIENNAKNLKAGKDKINKNAKELNDHFNKLEKVHNNIKTNGHNLKHTEYNKLVAEYGNLVKNYNSKRKNYCAELPPLWALKDRPKELYGPERQCDEWKFAGKEAGLLITKALFMVGYRYWGSSLTNHIKCAENIRKVYTNNHVQNRNRQCFFRNFENQIRFSFKPLRENKPIIINNPYKTNIQKKTEMKKIIKDVKRVMN